MPLYWHCDPSPAVSFFCMEIACCDWLKRPGFPDFWIFLVSFKVELNNFSWPEVCREPLTFQKKGLDGVVALRVWHPFSSSLRCHLEFPDSLTKHAFAGCPIPFHVLFELGCDCDLFISWRRRLCDTSLIQGGRQKPCAAKFKSLESHCCKLSKKSVPPRPTSFHWIFPDA